MQYRFLRIKPVFAAALALSVTPLATPAVAQDGKLSGADLALVMTAYVEGAVELRNLNAACAPTPWEGWEAGAALLVESLRAAGADSGLADALAARMAEPPATEGVDCQAEDLQLRAGLPAGEDWAVYHRKTLEAAKIDVVLPPRDDSRLAAAGAVVESAAGPQAQLFRCLSLFDPRGFVMLYVDWGALLEQVKAAFAATGYPPRVYDPVLSKLSPDTLFSPPADRGAAAAACVADREWEIRYTTFSWFSLAGDIKAALEGRAP